MNVSLICNEISCTYFREILEETVNREGPETTAHWDPR